MLYPRMANGFCCFRATIITAIRLIGSSPASAAFSGIEWNGELYPSFAANYSVALQRDKIYFEDFYRINGIFTTLLFAFPRR